MIQSTSVHVNTTALFFREVCAVFAGSPPLCWATAYTTVPMSTKCHYDARHSRLSCLRKGDSVDFTGGLRRSVRACCVAIHSVKCHHYGTHGPPQRRAGGTDCGLKFSTRALCPTSLSPGRSLDAQQLVHRVRGVVARWQPVGRAGTPIPSPRPMGPAGIASWAVMPRPLTWCSEDCRTLFQSGVRADIAGVCITKGRDDDR